MIRGVFRTLLKQLFAETFVNYLSINVSSYIFGMVLNTHLWWLLARPFYTPWQIFLFKLSVKSCFWGIAFSWIMVGYTVSTQLKRANVLEGSATEAIDKFTELVQSFQQKHHIIGWCCSNVFIVNVEHILFSLDSSN